MKVAVVGAGSWGTTIASIMAQHAQVTLWALEPAGMADGRVRRHAEGRSHHPCGYPGEEVWPDGRVP